MSDGMGREFTYLSSHATNRYFIPNWGKIGKTLRIWLTPRQRRHGFLRINVSPSRNGKRTFSTRLSFITKSLKFSMPAV